MSAFARLLSLRLHAVATMTVACVPRPSQYPPPFTRAALLALLLAAGLDGLVPLTARGDEIVLQAFESTVKTITTTSYPATSDKGPGEDFQYSLTGFRLGQGYTNVTEAYSRRSWLYNSQNNMACSTNALDWYLLSGTNHTIYPWVDGELVTGLSLGTGWDTESRWQLDGQAWITQTNSWLLNDDTNNSNPPQLTGAAPYPGWAYAYARASGEPGPDGGTFVETNVLAYTSTVVLLTHTNAGGTGKAFFRLTSGFDIPGATNADVLADNAGAYLFAGATPDAQGVVWKVLSEGTTNDLCVTIRDDFKATVTNFTFSPGQQRVPIGIEWKGSDTNTTNWSTGPVYALKGTTVLFRVTTGGLTGVGWPSGLPTWSHGGANGATTISVTFNTISANTNGEWVTVTAGSSASNQVVVYDFSIVAKGQDVDFSTSPRSLYGVGEKVDFTAGFDAAALSNSFPLTLTWSGQGSASTNGLQGADISKLDGQELSAGCQAETFTVTATLATGINAGASRTTNVTIIAPTNAILLPIKSAGIQEYVFAANTNVGHTQFSHSCVKKAYYQLQPDTVSFKGLSISEGTAAYSWLGGSTNVPGAIYYQGNWLNADPGNLAALAPHAQGGWVNIGHGNHLDGMYFNVADGPDTFGVAAGQGGLPTGTYMGQQVTLSPSPAKTNTVSIPLAYKVYAKTNVFISIESTKAFGPEGSTTIKKDGLGATKGYLEIDSPVE